MYPIRCVAAPSSSSLRGMGSTDAKLSKDSHRITSSVVLHSSASRSSASERILREVSCESCTAKVAVTSESRLASQSSSLLTSVKNAFKHSTVCMKGWGIVIKVSVQAHCSRRAPSSSHGSPRRHACRSREKQIREHRAHHMQHGQHVGSTGVLRPRRALKLPVRGHDYGGRLHK
eukprot:scaffold10642_cov121-Isochrysis_galbana.AAC.3